MPTLQFRSALQALRSGDETFKRDWQSPVPAECYDGLEDQAFVAAYLSDVVQRCPNGADLLVKLMERQEDRLTGILEMAEESGCTNYANSRSFHNHVKLTIDAVLRPENYSDEMQYLRDDDHAWAVIHLTRKALGIDQPRADRRANVEAARAPVGQGQAGRGRDDDEGPGLAR